MISPKYFAFFAALEKNNNKEWFDAHRSEYEQHVKEPFRAVVETLIERIQAVEPTLHVAAKDVMYRINKDIRFSKDKAPYKTHLAAHINTRGKKAMGYPGFYFEISAKGAAAAGGVYMPSKEELANVRDLIQHEGDALKQLLRAKNFVHFYGEIQGERNKVLPAEFRDAARIDPLIANKQFYYWANIPKSALPTNAADTLFEYYKAAKPVNDFFAKAFE